MTPGAVRCSAWLAVAGFWNLRPLRLGESRRPRSKPSHRRSNINLGLVLFRRHGATWGNSHPSRRINAALAQTRLQAVNNGADDPRLDELHVLESRDGVCCEVCSGDQLRLGNPVVGADRAAVNGKLSDALKRVVGPNVSPILGKLVMEFAESHGGLAGGWKVCRFAFGCHFDFVALDLDGWLGERMDHDEMVWGVVKGDEAVPKDANLPEVFVALEALEKKVGNLFVVLDELEGMSELRALLARADLFDVIANDASSRFGFMVDDTPYRHSGFCVREATANDPKLSDGGAWRGSCDGGAQKEATDV